MVVLEEDELKFGFHCKRNFNQNHVIRSLNELSNFKRSVLDFSTTEIYSNRCFLSYFIYGILYYLYYLTEDNKLRGHQQYGPRQRRHKLATRFDTGCDILCRFHTITYIILYIKK